MVAHNRHGALPDYATFDDVKDQITLLMQRVSRRREVRAALQKAHIRGGQIDRQLWADYEQGRLPLETGIGIVKRMLNEDWNKNFTRAG